MSLAPMSRTANPANLESGRRRRPRRSTKVCTRCHSRKSRCDAQRLGTPCSTCIELGAVCVLRKRKNARAATPEAWKPAVVDLADTAHESNSISASHAPITEAPINELWPCHDQLDMNSLSHIQSPQTVLSNYSFDLATLADFEQILNSAFPPSVEPQDLDLTQLGPVYDRPKSPPVTYNHIQALPEMHSPGSRPTTDWQVLSDRGCYDLPSPLILHALMQSYFRFVHPAVPMVSEDRVWAMWGADDTFCLGDFPLILLRAMIFTAVQFLDEEPFAALGFPSKRAARIELYCRTKWLMALSTFVDPIANAQASLLLTYFSPHDNRARVNSFWLMNAVRYAKIACANAFFLNQDLAKAKRLKRLWWSVLFRDRIMSLGLRRAPLVELDQHLLGETHILTSADFEPELGKSKVHSLKMQLDLIQSITCMCRLAQALTPCVFMLYSQEVLSLRVRAIVAASPQKSLSQINQALARLRDWHDDSIRIFPSPITLDEETAAIGSLSVIVNMLFCYHASAKFALEIHRLLVNELVGLGPISLTSVKALESSVDDIATRVQELLHARLTGYLPISISAYIAPSLVLQAMNLASVRGNQLLERIETHRLHTFQRVLSVQHAQYDGTDFIVDTLDNVSSRATGDCISEESATAPLRGRSVVKGVAHWSSLATRRPRALLRLLYHLDRMLCSGGPPAEHDPFPSELLDS